MTYKKKPSPKITNGKIGQFPIRCIFDFVFAFFHRLSGDGRALAQKCGDGRRKRNERRMGEQRNRTNGRRRDGAAAKGGPKAGQKKRFQGRQRQTDSEIHRKKRRKRQINGRIQRKMIKKIGGKNRSKRKKKTGTLNPNFIPYKYTGSEMHTKTLKQIK